MEAMALLNAFWRQQEEGAIICDGEGTIRLSNPAARRLLRNHGKEGESVFDLFSPAPIRHALEMLQCSSHRQSAPQHQSDTKFLCAQGDATGLFCCCVHHLQVDAAGPHCFIIILKHGNIEDDQASLLPAMVENLRHPLANLRAAVDTLTAPQELPSVMRSAFENILVQECVTLTTFFERLVDHSRAVGSRQLLFSSICLPDLLCCLNRRLARVGDARVDGSGESLWIKADSHELLLLLELFVHKITVTMHPATIRCEAHTGDRIVFIDLVWPGEPMRALDIEGWLLDRLTESVRGRTVAEVLRRHDSEIWSQAHTRAGYAMLRVPVPAADGV